MNGEERIPRVADDFTILQWHSFPTQDEPERAFDVGEEGTRPTYEKTLIEYLHGRNTYCSFGKCIFFDKKPEVAAFPLGAFLSEPRLALRNDESFFCSDIIKVSTGNAAEIANPKIANSKIANLEQINPNGCEVTMQDALPVGTPVKMQCLECPQNKPCCSDCVFFGVVRSNQTDQVLGNSMAVDFEGRKWSKKEWRPRHLMGIPPGSVE